MDENEHVCEFNPRPSRRVAYKHHQSRNISGTGASCSDQKNQLKYPAFMNVYPCM